MLLVVDAAEGVMVVTEKAVKQAIMEGLPICLLISKVNNLPSIRSSDAEFRNQRLHLAFSALVHSWICA